MASALEIITANNKKTEEAFTKAVGASAAQMQDSVVAQRNALDASAAATIELFKADADAAAARKVDKQKIAEQLGVTPQDEQRAKLSVQIGLAKDDLIKANEELATISNSSFADNPLGWLVDQFRMPFVQEQVKAAEGRFKDMTTAYSTLDSIAQNGFQTVNALNETDAAAKFAAQMKVTNADAAFKSAQLDREAARDGLAAARDLYNVGKDGNAQAWQVLNYETQRRNHAESMAMQRKHMEMAQADKKEEEDYYKILKVGYAALVDPAQRTAVEGMPSKAIKQMLADNAPLRNAAYSAGMQVIKNNGKYPSNIIYDVQSPSSAVNIMEQVGAPPSASWIKTMRAEWAANGPQFEAARGVVNGQLQLQLATDGTGKKIPTSPAFDAGVKEWLLAKAKNIDPKDGSNPMLAPSLSELIAVNPELGETYAVRLLKEMGAGGDDLRSASATMQKIMQADPKVDINQLSQDIANIYGHARAYKNARNGFQSMGIPDAVLEAGYVQGKVDYTKPEQVAKAAMQVKLSKQDVEAARAQVAQSQDAFNAMWNTGKIK